MRWLSIIGIGEDGLDGLSPQARSLVSEAELVVGGSRHLAMAASLVRGATLVWPSPIDTAFPAILARRGKPVVVLASGDPFNYGIGKQLAAIVAADEMISLPQPSAFSLAASRLGWALQDVAEVTLHGRPLENLIRVLHPGRRILALSWDGTTPGKVKELLVSRGLGRSRVTVFERMGGPAERRRSGTGEALDTTNVDALNVIAIEVAGDAKSLVIPRASGLDDALFETDGQLTKREIRAVVLSSLAPRYGERLWDIGLGSGSVAIEWLLADPSLSAIGIEERPDRAARARRNALALGAPALQVVEGRAPAALAGLPPPDAVFIGGGITDDGVFDVAWDALKPGGRFVANAVTLEAEARLAALSAVHGGDLIRLAISRAEPLGGMTGWRPALPITHWRAVKP